MIIIKNQFSYIFDTHNYNSYNLLIINSATKATIYYKVV